MERGICEEPRAKTTSLSSIEKAAAISLTDGCAPCSRVYSSMNALMSRAVFLSARETFTLPSSRKKRLISPAIMGTAYVEKRTPKRSSKPEIAFKSPMQASSKRSSYSTPLLR